MKLRTIYDKQLEYRLNYIFQLAALIALVLAGNNTYAQKPDIPTIIERARTLINKGEAATAINVADSALQLAIQQKDNKSRINAMRIKGKGLFAADKKKEAAELYFEALRFCTSPADDKETAMLYREIGYTYFSQGHPREAKEYYKKEIAIKISVYGRDSIGEQLINLAVMHDQLKEKDSAFMVLKEVDAILTRNDNLKLRGYYYLNLGALLESVKKLDSAEYFYRRAYDVWHQIGNESQIYKATFNIGYVAEEKGNYAEAIKYYKLCEESAKKFGFQTEIAHVYGTMAEAYASLKDYKNAYTYLYKYAILNDSLSKGEFNNYVVKLDKQFQTDKNRETIQQQKIKLQDANLEVQKQQNKALLIIVILIGVVLIAVIVIGYTTFKGRVQRQVEAAKQQFFANVVHEIRTPLSMIQGPIKVLQGQVNDPAQLYQLDMAERNTTRLNELVNQMLDISKVDAGKYQLNESVGNIDQFLEDITRQYQVLATEKGVILLKQAETNTGNILFDKDALEKTIGNLVSNAIKYTAAGGTVGLDVAAEQAGAGLNFTFTVWDTGKGIPKDEQQKIFNRFFRSKEQVDAGTKGIGIGLSLVSDLVQLMNGTINVESEPGKGAVFTVQIPLRPAETTVAGNSADTAGHTILLVEDDADILAFNKILLTEKGYHVRTAANGIDAIAALKDELPDIIITDLMMPGKDGLAVIKEVRSNPLTDHIPVIILSAKASAQSKMEGVTEGAQVYLSKPFQPEELVGMVRNQLSIIERQKTRYRENTEQQNIPIEERFSGDDPFTRKCYAVIQEHLDDAQLSVEKLAELMNINRSHFQRKIKALTGYSPSELIKTIRLEKAKELLQKKEGNITEVAYATGFTSQSYFTKCFSDHFGYPPSQEVKKI